MDATRDRTRSVIVHRNPVIAQDLREILASVGADEIEVVSSLSDVTPGPVVMMFVSGHYSEIAVCPIIERWRSLGTKIVVLNGKSHDGSDKLQGIFVIETPFRTQDIEGVVSDLGVFR